MTKQHLRILSLLEDRPWAITSRMLETILEIVQQPLHEAADLDAVAARIGRPLGNTSGEVQVRDTVAILEVSGPIFRHANLMTHYSGATSIQDLSTDLQTVVENPMIKHVVLDINSPGGQYDGTNELADRIRLLSKQKPITAYVGGIAASAAYWFASSVGRIVANESAFLGSIGVVAAIQDRRGAQERQGIKNYEIVSSQSPRKRPDLETAEGRAQIQEQIDIAAELFINKVAGFRGVSAETVIEQFGRGGMLPAAAAKKAGMIDAIGNYEGLIEELNSKEVTYVSQPAAAGAPAPDPKPSAPAQPTTSEIKSRIQQILTCEDATGRTVLAQHLAFQTDMSVEDAKQIMKASPAAATQAAAPPAPPADPLKAAMAQIPNPKVGPGAPEDTENDAAAEARAVLAFVPKSRRVQAS